MDPQTPQTPQPQIPPQGGTPPSYGAAPQYSQTPQNSYTQTPQQNQSMPPAQQYTPPQNTWTAPQPNSPYPQPLQSSQQHDMSYTPPPRPRTYGKPPAAVRFVEWLKGHWYVPLLAIVLIALLGNIIWQVLVPTNALPAGLVVDGVRVGGMDRDAAVQLLNKGYAKEKVNLFFGDTSVPYKTPTASELGVEVDNTTRLAGVSYPFALRFVPSSYWWAAGTASVGEPTYNYDQSTLDIYTLKNLGEECVIPPKNASLKLDDNLFTVIPAEVGGKCNVTDFKDQVSKVTYDGGFNVKTGIKEVAAPLTDEIARQLGDELNNNLKNDLPLQAGGKTTKVSATTVKGWLSFKPFIPEDKNDGAPLPPPRLLYVIEPERVQRYLQTSGIVADLEKKPGVTKVATTNFTETSRTNGAPGVLVDIKKTIANIDSFATARASNAAVVVGSVQPTVQYSRKYTPTADGYAALIQQFATDNPGKIAISFTELTGKRPYYGGSANAEQQMPAAGIEGTAVFYAAQKGIEDGSIQPTDRILGSLSVEDCMEVAISDQNEDCITGLLSKMGNERVEARIAEVGLTGTSFSGSVNVTTARDMALFMQQLGRNDLPIRNKSVLEIPMRDIALRDGIISVAPSSARVAGGATDTNYNEMAFITENGQYAVSIMTQGSAGSKTTVKLVKAIDALKQQKQDL